MYLWEKGHFMVLVVFSDGELIVKIKNRDLLMENIIIEIGFKSYIICILVKDIKTS